MTTGLCAYAITRDHSFDAGGTPDPDVRLIAHAGLGLVVAEVDLAPFTELGTEASHWSDEPAEDDPLVVLARRHDAVVRAVFRDRPVLPLRFGTIVRDRDAAVRLLADRHAPASACLDRVEGHREWSVRARRVEATEPENLPADGLSGTEYLAMRRQRLAKTLGARRRGAEVAEALHEALSKHATESAPRGRRAPGLLIDAAYLVPEDHERVFHAEAGRLGGEPGVTMVVTGPWPPYSFTRLELPAKAAADA
jgi:hypothetical protein